MPIMTAPIPVQPLSFFEDYKRRFPSHLKERTFTSFGLGFAVTAILTVNPLLGLISGIFSAVASLIHTLVTPLFERWMESSPYYLRNMCKTFTAVTLTALSASLLDKLIHFIKSLFLNLTYDGAQAIFKDQIPGDYKSFYMVNFS